MTQKKCPITIFYEDNELSYVSNIVYDLIPVLKKLNFTSLAVEQAGDMGKAELLKQYKLLAILYLADIPVVNENHLATYRMLNKASSYEFDIKSIDLKDMKLYQKLTEDYQSFNARFNVILSDAINQLYQNGESSLKSFQQNKDGRLLVSAPVNTLFNNELVSDKINVNGVKASFFSKLYNIEELKVNYGLRFDHKYISLRNKNFVTEIERLCQKEESGVVAIVSDSHYIISKILEQKGYKVQSYYVGDSFTADSFASFMEYAPSILDPSAKNITFFDINKQSLGEIVGAIEQNLIDHLSL